MKKLLLLAMVIGLLANGCTILTTASIPAQPNQERRYTPKLGTNDGTSIKF